MILFMNCELYSTHLCLLYASFVLNFIFFVKVTSLLIIGVHWGFPCGSVVKNLPAIQETQVWSLGREDPLEKGMAAHASLLSWRIPWTEETDGLQSTGSQRIGHSWAVNTSYPSCPESFGHFIWGALRIIIFLFLFKNCFKSYWNIVDLQCCVIFRTIE